MSVYMCVGFFDSLFSFFFIIIFFGVWQAKRVAVPI